MNNRVHEVGSAGDEIELLELLTEIWRRRWLIGAFTAVGLLAAVLYLQRATYEYTARLKVTPAQSTQSGSGSRLGGLAGLASIAGISVGQDPGSMSFLLYKEGVASRSVAEALSRRPDLMKVIFADEWDEKAQRFVEPSPGPVRSVILVVKSVLGIPNYAWRRPDAARLQDYIERNVEVLDDAESPVMTLVYSHEDPRFAAEFLAEIHRVLDSGLRRRARDRATQYIGYLAGQLETARLIEHRTALAQALAEQERNRMMASSSLAFAAEPVDPAAASLRPTNPVPTLVLIIGFVVGGVVGIGTALLTTQVSKYRERALNPAA